MHKEGIKVHREV